MAAGRQSCVWLSGACLLTNSRNPTEALPPQCCRLQATAGYCSYHRRTREPQELQKNKTEQKKRFSEGAAGRGRAPPSLRRLWEHFQAPQGLCWLQLWSLGLFGALWGFSRLPGENGAKWLLQRLIWCLPEAAKAVSCPACDQRGGSPPPSSRAPSGRLGLFLSLVFGPSAEPSSSGEEPASWEGRLLLAACGWGDLGDKGPREE